MSSYQVKEIKKRTDFCLIKIDVFHFMISICVHFNGSDFDSIKKRFPEQEVVKLKVKVCDIPDSPLFSRLSKKKKKVGLYFKDIQR